MSKTASLTLPSAGYMSATAISTAINAVNDKLTNTLSLDGSTPNAMNADLDLNSNDIINGKYLYATRLYLNGSRVTSATSTPDWKGAWATSNSYGVDDLVKNDGNVYICLEDHTSGTFATDLSLSKWELFVSKGSTGAGTGDMLAANNLSDLADAASSRSNLGLGNAATYNVTGSDSLVVTGTAGGTDRVAKWNVDGDVVDAGVILPSSLTAGDILYATDTETLSVLNKGSAGQLLAMNSGATAPEWTSTSSWTEGNVATTSGTSITVLSSLSGVSEIELWFDEVSADTAVNWLLRVGTGGTSVATGYNSESALAGSGGTRITSTTGFALHFVNTGYFNTGVLRLYNVTGNRWLASHNITQQVGGATSVGNGDITLAGELDIVELIPSATANFDSGSIYYRYR